MRDEKDLVYTHRVHYTFTELNEPARRGVKAHQDFTREDWAREFLSTCKDSPYFEKSYIREIKDEL